MNALLKIMLCTMPFVFAACSTEVAGGTSEETNTIAGVLTNSSGKVLSGVVVAARLADAGSSASDTSVYADTTDSEGRFVLKPDTYGEYGVSAVTDSSAFYALTEYVGKPVALSGRLFATSSIAGNVYLRPDSAASGAVVCIPGTAWRTVADSNGSFNLKGIPGGEYFVSVISPSPSYVMSSYYKVSIPVDSGVAASGSSSSADTTLKTSGPVSSGVAADVAFEYVNFMSWVLPLSTDYAVKGYWTMDYLTPTASAGTFNDVRGFTGVATLYGGSLVTGRNGAGYALSLSGADEFAVIENDNGVLDSATALTVEAWVNVKDLMDTGSVYEKNIFGKLGFSDTSVFSLAVIKGKCGVTEPSFAFFLAGGTGDSLSCASAAVDSVPVTTDEWINLVAVWNGSTISLYRNGMLAMSAKTSVSRLSAPASVSVYFGKENLSVLVDDVRWSTAVLTGDDVFYRYNE